VQKSLDDSEGDRKAQRQDACNKETLVLLALAIELLAGFVVTEISVFMQVGSPYTKTCLKMRKRKLPQFADSHLNSSEHVSDSAL